MATVAPVIASFSPDTNILGDGTTNSNRITLSGRATPSTTINLFDGAALLGTAAVNAAGNWSFTTGTLSNAVHSFTATDSDGAGNTSAPSSALTVTVDTVAPATPSISSWSPDSVNNYDYGVTNSNHLTVNGTAEANSTVNVFDNGVKIGTATTNTTGVWTFNTGVVPDGINALTVSATDAAGNSSGQTFFATHAIVDTSAPTTPTLIGGSQIGVMMEGAESSWIGFPGTTDLDYLKSHGVDLVRLPISWELMQNTLNGPLNSTYLAGLEKFLDQAAQRGMQVIVELHNHGEYDPTWQQDKAAHGGLFSSAWQIGQPIGSSAVPVSSFGNFWTQLATALNGHAGVAGYDLMNEPAYISYSAWQTTAQSAVDAIRTVDTNTAIYVEGGQWSVASTWQLPWYSGNLHVTDPANNIVYEAHQYFDANSSGLYGQPFNPQTDYTNMGADLLQPWVNWLHANDVQGFLGEFGAPVTDPRWLPIVNALLDYMQANGISGTYCNYTYKQWADISIAPENNQGAAMMELIFEHSAPSIAGFVPNNGTGNNGTTTANVLTLNGTGASFCAVKVFDNGTLVGTATSDVSGAWSLTTPSLSNGLHNFTATNVDAAGNSSELSFTMAVTVTSNSVGVIDTVAPVAPTIAAFSTDSGVAGDHITNDNTLALTGTAEANSTVKIYDGANLLNSVTANGTGGWSYTTAALADGGHSLTATATDAAGNTGASSSALVVTIDTAAPSVPTIASYSTDSGVAGDHITNDNTLTLTGTAEANSMVKVFDGASLLGSVAANGSGAWSYTTAALVNGVHSLTATATDAAGNTGATSSALAVTIDTAAPSAPTIASYSTDSGVAGDHITNDNTPTLTGTAEANSTVKIYDGATLLGAVAATGSGAWSYTTAVLVNGVHSLTATATDVAGNTGIASAALALTIDTVAPAVPTIASFSTDSGVSGDHITNDNTLTLTGAAEANSTVRVYDGSTLLGSAMANGSGVWSYTTAALIDGGHSLTATATDAAGNTGSASTGAPSGGLLNLATTSSGAAGNVNALNVILDTTAPNAPVITSDTIVNTNHVMLSGTAEAGSNLAVFDGVVQLGTTTANGSGAWSFTTGALSANTHVFTAKASDVAGNTSIASQPVSAPILTVIESFGSTSLTQLGNTYYLGSGPGPSLKSGGVAFTAGSAGGWTPIGVEQTASGFEVAWKVTGSDQYGIWLTDSNGNFMSNPVGVVSGHSTTWTSLEASFHQDLNGDGVISVAPPPPPPPSATVIEAFGSTSLTQVGSAFYLDDSNGSGPSLKSGGAAFAAGSAGGWTPIGAEQTASGYEVAWKVTGTDQYGIWMTDSNGNFLSNPVGVVSGSSMSWKSLEASFHQDLNGDGVINGPLLPSNPTAIESFGSTSLTQIGSTFYLYDSNQSGPSLKNGGVAFAAGSAGGWTPIGAEQTATGYEVAWKVAGSDQYGIWLTDNNGNFLSNPVGVVSGNSTTWKSLEASFHQDLNGDGVITGAGPAPANIVSGTLGNDTLTSTAANEVFFGNGGLNTFVFSGGFGKDVVADFQPNNDVVQLNHSVFADFASVLAHSAQVGSDVVVTVDAANSITLANTALSHLTSHNFHLV